jgi:hypothetical protein
MGERENNRTAKISYAVNVSGGIVQLLITRCCHGDARRPPHTHICEMCIDVT